MLPFDPSCWSFRRQDEGRLCQRRGHRLRGSPCTHNLRLRSYKTRYQHNLGCNRLHVEFACRRCYRMIQRNKCRPGWTCPLQIQTDYCTRTQNQTTKPCGLCVFRCEVRWYRDLSFWIKAPYLFVSDQDYFYVTKANKRMHALGLSIIRVMTVVSFPIVLAQQCYLGKGVHPPATVLKVELWSLERWHGPPQEFMDLRNGSAFIVLEQRFRLEFLGFWPQLCILYCFPCRL